MKAEWTNKDSLTQCEITKAILVIETDAKHIEDLYVETIWNDYVLVDLGKEYHFKPMPQKMRTDADDIEEDSYYQGWNDCLDEILGETE